MGKLPDPIPEPSRFPPEFHDWRFFVPEVLGLLFLGLNWFMAYLNATTATGDLWLGISVVGMVICLYNLYRWGKRDLYLMRKWTTYRRDVKKFNETIDYLNGKR